MADYTVAIISARRPDSVAKLARWTDGLSTRWYVGEGDATAYAAAGAGVAGEYPLVAARNAALDDADGWCIQLDDDLMKLGLAAYPGCKAAEVSDLPLAEAIERMIRAATEWGAQLAGVAPTANPYFARREVTTTGFCVGDLLAIAPGCPLRFDPAIDLKEDYDYTLQHLAAYSTVARCDTILATFQHRTNPGGAVTYRTPEKEQAAIAYLSEKWPGSIRPNAKRQDEILMRWPPVL